MLASWACLFSRRHSNNTGNPPPYAHIVDHEPLPAVAFYFELPYFGLGVGFYEVKQIHIVIRIFERNDKLPFCRNFLLLIRYKKFSASATVFISLAFALYGAFGYF